MMTRYTELEISSDILDQPAFAGKPKKVFICSTPRTGSYLLCRHMINAGLGVPHEYFNPFVIGQIAPRLGFDDAFRALRWRPRGLKDTLGLRKGERAAEQAFLERYLQALAPRRCQGGVFAAKIHFRDFRGVLDNPVGQRLLDGGLFVYLYREDLLGQAVSEHFGQLSGRWGIDDTVTTPPALDGDYFDAAAIDRAVDDLSEQERGWRVFLARRGAAPMSISYEKLCEDPFSFVAAIGERIGADPGALRRGYDETDARALEGTQRPSKAEAARHYLATPPSSKQALVRDIGYAAMKRLLGT
jgi:LPS sulfotransferase NodH